MEKEFDGKGYGDFKSAVAEVVVEYFRPIRTYALELLEDESHLLRTQRGAIPQKVSQSVDDRHAAMGRRYSRVYVPSIHSIMLAMMSVLAGFA